MNLNIHPIAPVMNSVSRSPVQRRRTEGISSRLRQGLLPARGVALGLLISAGVMMGCSPANLESQTLPNRPPGTESSPNQAPSQKVILTTFTVLADMAQNVAGDKAVVHSLTKLGSEIHGYEPTPSDMLRAQKVNLILDNGLNLERWAAKFYSNVPKVPHITLSQGVEPLMIGPEVAQGKPNPHAWMSPRNALIYVENIRQALSNLDPTHADTYHRNAIAYSQKIRQLDDKLRTELSVLPPQHRYLVSCEGAFSYLTKDYGLNELYLWAVNAEQQATPQQIQRVIKTVKDQKIPAVFCESTVNHQIQKQVAQESGARFAGIFYVDSLSPSHGPAPTYLKLLEHNVTTLIRGLQGYPTTPLPP
jgi:manganese transport system substrate-binding protein